MGFDLQICSVFLLLVASMHRLLAWGFICHPHLAMLFTTLYYSAAAACIMAGVNARTALQRGLPLILLLLVRFAALATRKLLPSGSQEALGHYLVMEVSIYI